MSVKPTTVTKEGKEIFNISWHAIGPEEVLKQNFLGKIVGAN